MAIYGPRQRQLLSIVGLGAAGVGVLAGSRVRLRRADGTPPTTAAFIVGPDAAGVGVLAGPRARLRRADGARPSSFPPPLARPLFSS